jgi:hypothetical protein
LLPDPLSDWISKGTAAAVGPFEIRISGVASISARAAASLLCRVIACLRSECGNVSDLVQAKYAAAGIDRNG